jgi:hypothetical protein
LWIFLAAPISFAFSCSLLNAPPQVVISIPQRPVLGDCPAKPVIEGNIINGKVVLEMTDAQQLSDWTRQIVKCQRDHEIILNGHIDKLENRLKALGAK